MGEKTGRHTDCNSGLHFMLRSPLLRLYEARQPIARLHGHACIGCCLGRLRADHHRPCGHRLAAQRLPNFHRRPGDPAGADRDRCGDHSEPARMAGGLQAGEQAVARCSFRRLWLHGNARCNRSRQSRRGSEIARGTCQAAHGCRRLAGDRAKDGRGGRAIFIQRTARRGGHGHRCRAESGRGKTSPPQRGGALERRRLEHRPAPVAGRDAPADEEHPRLRGAARLGDAPAGCGADQL